MIGDDRNLPGEPGLRGPEKILNYSTSQRSLESRSMQSNVTVEMNVWQILPKNVCKFRGIDETVIALATKE